jgi:hypothetical protein
MTLAPQRVVYPRLLDCPPFQVLGYPIETVIAEKLTTAIDLADANTRIRDYVDLWRLTGIHDLRYDAMRDAATATASFRGTPLRRLSDALSSFGTARQSAYAAFRKGLGPDAEGLPQSLVMVVNDVVRFADPLLDGLGASCTWKSPTRTWQRTDR